MRPQRNNASRHAHVHVLRGQLLGRALAKLLGHLPGRVRPRKPVRISRVSERLDFVSVFCGVVETGRAAQIPTKGPFRESSGSIAVGFEKRQENALVRHEFPQNHL